MTKQVDRKSPVKNAELMDFDVFFEICKFFRPDFFTKLKLRSFKNKRYSQGVSHVDLIGVSPSPADETAFGCAACTLCPDPS